MYIYIVSYIYIYIYRDIYDTIYVFRAGSGGGRALATLDGHDAEDVPRVRELQGPAVPRAATTCLRLIMYKLCIYTR